eukprot:7945391-Prorocentrum_lima.AAC.1
MAASTPGAATPTNETKKLLLERVPSRAARPGSICRGWPTCEPTPAGSSPPSSQHGKPAANR